MKTLTQEEIQLISGGNGATNSEANKVIGEALGTAWHCLTSKEALIGGFLGPNGWITGAVIHYKTQH